MRQERLWARQRSKYRVATIDKPPFRPDCTESVAGPEADATQLSMGNRRYVVAVLDVYTRRIVGWATHQTLDAPLVIRALQMAIDQRRPKPSLIVHSDRGTQFAVPPFVKPLPATSSSRR